METIRQETVLPVNVEGCKSISVFELGTTAKDMLKNWKIFRKEGTQVSLKEFPDIDFMQTIHGQELMDIVLHVAMLIEMNKKKLAKERQARGIAEAKRKGIKLGRREKEIPSNFTSIYKKVNTKQMTMKKATELLDVDYKTYKKWVKKYREKK